MAMTNAERQAAHRAKLKAENDRHQLNTYISHEAWTRLAELAKRDGVTAAEVIEALLRNALPEVRVEAKKPAPTAADRLEQRGQERLF